MALTPCIGTYWLPNPITCQCQCDKPARDDLLDNGIESLGGFLGVRMWRGPTAGAAVGLRLAAEAGRTLRSRAR